MIIKIEDCTVTNTVAVEVGKLAALRKDAARYHWLLARIKAYDMDGPALLFSWPAGVAFNFGAPTDSIDAAMAGQGELVLHNV